MLTNSWLKLQLHLIGVNIVATIDANFFTIIDIGVVSEGIGSKIDWNRRGGQTPINSKSIIFYNNIVAHVVEQPVLWIIWHFVTAWDKYQLIKLINIEFILLNENMLVDVWQVDIGAATYLRGPSQRALTFSLCSSYVSTPISFERLISCAKYSIVYSGQKNSNTPLHCDNSNK